MSGRSATLLELVLLTSPITLALRDHEFRKCKDTPFCEKHRVVPAADAPSWTVDTSSIENTGPVWSARIEPADSEQIALRLEVSVLRSGAVRVHAADDPSVPLESLELPDPSVTKPEEWDDEMDGSWDAPMVKLGRAVKPRYEPTEPFASPDALTPVPCVKLPSTAADSAGSQTLSCDAHTPVLVRITFAPLVIEVLDPTTRAAVVRFNGRRRLLFEPFRQLIPSGEAEAQAPEPVRLHTLESKLDRAA